MPLSPRAQRQAPNPITIIQGGQYGSEAKGAIAGYICRHEGTHYAVRTGATNAGHTVYHHGVGVKMQQLPVGWVNPNTILVVGAGALIDPHILERECREVSDLTGEDIKRRVIIDYRAGMHMPAHAERSKASGRHHAIGATGKGCSEALIDKIKGRGKNYSTFGQTRFAQDYEVTDTCALLNHAFDDGAKIMLEGTQGTLLDLHLGPYPYTTHKQTVPSVWMAESGLSPSLPTDIVMVLRTYPIRVAGNSGPLPGELGWPELARLINLRREEHGLPPIVGEWAIDTFETYCRRLAKNWGPGIVNSDGLDMHKWDARKREAYAEVLSEFHAHVLSNIHNDNPDAFKELLRLFELTTVTKKLRRIARMSEESLNTATMLCRPHRVAMMFMNYIFSQYWFDTLQKAEADQKVYNYVRQLESMVKCPVSHISFGPADEHVIANPFQSESSGR